MDSKEIADQIRKTISKRLHVREDQVTDEARFREDLTADSLDTVELVMELEEEHNLKIPDEVVGNMNTVGDAIRYICSKKCGVQQ